MNKMTTAEFDRREEMIERANPAPTKDQSIAKLYIDSGWTQQEIADHTGMSKSWVGYQLCFGRFLKFSTNGGNPRNLTERAFRNLWEETSQEDSEQVRFRAVAAALGFAPAAAPGAAVASLDAEIADLAAAIGVDAIGKSQSHYPRRSEIKKVLERGEPNIVAMVRSRQIGLTLASYYVRHTPRDVQTKAAVAEVKRVYNEYKRERLTKKAASAPEVSINAKNGKGGKNKAKARNVWMPPKDTTIKPKLINLSIEGIDNNSDPTVRVHLWPPNVRALMADLDYIGMSASHVTTLALQTDTDTAFAPAMERLLAYVPIPGKTNGWQRDFAAEAREDLRRIIDTADQAEANLRAIRKAARRLLGEDKLAESERWLNAKYGKQAEQVA